MGIRSENAIRKEIINDSKRRLGATYYGAGSMLDGLATDISKQIAQLEAQQEQILRDIHFNTIAEDQISKYAEDFNVKRKIGRKAKSESTDFNVLVSSTNGLSINSNLRLNNIEIVGLTLTSGNKKYFITEIEPNGYSQLSAYVGVQAYALGADFNVSKGELNKFEKSYQGLTVTNTRAILNGEDLETMDSIRNRILEKIESNANTEFILNSAISRLSGLGKTTIIRNYDGPGALMVCVQPYSGVVYPESTIRELQTKLEMEIGAGRKVLVKNFDPVGFVFKTTITAKAGFTATNLIDSVKIAISDYFNGLSGGQSVSLGALAARVLNSVPGVKSLGSGSNSFDSVVYTTYEGSAKFKYIASPGESISILDTQIATLGSPDGSPAVIIDVIE